MRAFRVSVRHTVSRESRVIRFLVMSVHLHGGDVCSARLMCRVNHVCEAEDGLQLSASSL